MKNKEWVAFSCILGVIAGFVLTNTGADDREAGAFWLIYAISAGVVVNTAEGLPSWDLLKASFPSPLCLALTLLFRLHVQGATFVSGMEVTHSSLDQVRVALIFAVSVGAVWVFSHARPAVLKVLQSAIGLPRSRARKIEERLNWIIKILGLLSLLLHTLLG